MLDESERVMKHMERQGKVMLDTSERVICDRTYLCQCLDAVAGRRGNEGATGVQRSNGGGNRAEIES
jgi:hypothetical protein